MLKLNTDCPRDVNTQFSEGVRDDLYFLYKEPLYL